MSAIIAQGERQVHKDIHGDKYVLFDGGIYAVGTGSKTKMKGSEEWIECEANADEISGKASVIIGGVEMDYVFTPNSPIDKKGSGEMSHDDEPDRSDEGRRLLFQLIQNEVHRHKTIKRRR